MKKCNVIFIIIVCLFPSILFAKHLHPEKYYQSIWCDENKGKTEQILKDGTRCDCLTEDYAVEVDFAQKWAESIGQSLHYALMTRKQPGILLIIEKDSEWKYYNRVVGIIEGYNLPVKVWVITP